VRSLSLKIFLSFWLAMLLIVVATAAITFFILAELREQAPRSPRAFANEAAVALARDGREGLVEWLRSRGSRISNLRVYVLTPDNQDLLGRRVPRFVTRRQWESPAPFAPRDAPGVSYRPPQALPTLIGPDGAAYRFLVLPARPSRFGLLGAPQTRLVLLIVALIVTGGVSYLLARSITRPINDLNRATQKLAGGDLEARASAATLARGDELARLGASFDTMAQRIRELIRSRERLLRDISHELRSPLARMRVALGLVRQPGADAQRQIERLESETERLNGLIGQILAVSRLGTAGVELEMENVDLGALIDSVARDAAYEAQSVNKTVSWTPPAQRVQLRGNAHWLGSAIENVVRNALRHTPEGGQIHIELAPARGQVAVRVRDEGPGVPASEVERIFEPFYRTASARDRDSGGEGLGLAITARVIQAHNGRIQARNAPGQGLEVELVLPLQ
jgi:two-component system sensor histidine kinase CpxA